MAAVVSVEAPIENEIQEVTLDGQEIYVQYVKYNDNYIIEQYFKNLVFILLRLLMVKFPFEVGRTPVRL